MQRFTQGTDIGDRVWENEPENEAAQLINRNWGCRNCVGQKSGSQRTHAERVRVRLVETVVATARRAELVLALLVELLRSVERSRRPAHHQSESEHDREPVHREVDRIAGLVGWSGRGEVEPANVSPVAAWAIVATNQGDAIEPMPPMPVTSAPVTARIVSGLALLMAQPTETGPLVKPLMSAKVRMASARRRTVEEDGAAASQHSSQPISDARVASLSVAGADPDTVLGPSAQISRAARRTPMSARQLANAITKP